MSRKQGSKVENSGEWKEGFLASLRQVPNVLRAAKAVDIARSLAYRERETNAIFAAEWDEAFAEGKAVAIEAVESKVYDLATNNSSFRHNTLRIFVLKSWKPEVYGEKSELKLKGSKAEPIQHVHGVDLSGVSEADLDLLERILTKGTSIDDTDGDRNTDTNPS